MEQKLNPQPVEKHSPSSIISYMKCPHKFCWTRILGLLEPSSPHWDRGTMLHEALNKFYDLPFEHMLPDYQKIINGAWDIFNAQWTVMITGKEALFTTPELKKRNGPATVQEWHHETRKIFKKFIRAEMDALEGYISQNSSTFRALEIFRPRHRELWLEIYTPIHLRGYVDRIARRDKLDSNGEPNLKAKSVTIVTDYKSSKEFNLGFPEDFELQLKLYAYMYWKKTGTMPDWGTIYYLRTGRIYYMRIRLMDLEEAEELLKRVAHELHVNGVDPSKFRKRTGKLCAWCFLYENKKCDGGGIKWTK